MRQSKKRGLRGGEGQGSRALPTGLVTYLIAERLAGEERQHGLVSINDGDQYFCRCGKPMMGWADAPPHFAEMTTMEVMRWSQGVLHWPLKPDSEV